MADDGVLRRRWSGDERGRGVGDGGPALPAIDLLRAEMTDRGWLAEDVGGHLARSLDRAAAAIGSEVRLTTSPKGFLTAEATVDAGGPGELRAIAYRWLAEIAEGQTFVRERREGRRATYLISTGQPDGARFAAHGHLIELRLTRAVD